MASNPGKAKSLSLSYRTPGIAAPQECLGGGTLFGNYLREKTDVGLDSSENLGNGTLFGNHLREKTGVELDCYDCFGSDSLGNNSVFDQSSHPGRSSRYGSEIFADGSAFNRSSHADHNAPFGSGLLFNNADDRSSHPLNRNARFSSGPTASNVDDCSSLLSNRNARFDSDPLEISTEFDAQYSFQEKHFTPRVQSNGPDLFSNECDPKYSFSGNTDAAHEHSFGNLSISRDSHFAPSHGSKHPLPEPSNKRAPIYHNALSPTSNFNRIFDSAIAKSTRDECNTHIDRQFEPAKKNMWAYPNNNMYELDLGSLPREFSMAQLSSSGPSERRDSVFSSSSWPSHRHSKNELKVPVFQDENKVQRRAPAESHWDTKYSRKDQKLQRRDVVEPSAWKNPKQQKSEPVNEKAIKEIGT